VYHIHSADEIFPEEIPRIPCLGRIPYIDLLFRGPLGPLSPVSDLASPRLLLVRYAEPAQELYCHTPARYKYIVTKVDCVTVRSMVNIARLTFGPSIVLGEGIRDGPIRG